MQHSATPAIPGSAQASLSHTTTDVHRWTFDYVKRHMKEVPERMPVAVVLNFRDMPASLRQVRVDVVGAHCELAWMERKPTPITIDASMLNCYGLGVRAPCHPPAPRVSVHLSGGGGARWRSLRVTVSSCARGAIREISAAK